MRKNRMMPGCGSAGFTLVEVLIVVAILGILAAVVVVNYGDKQKGAMIKATRSSISSVCVAVDLYQVDVGSLPQGMNNLLQSSGESNWDGPYVRGGAPKDAWGTPLQYTLQGDKTYEVRSAGPDRQMGTGDDLMSFANE